MAQFKPIKFKETVAKQNGSDSWGNPIYTYVEEDRSYNLREFQKAELPTARFWLMLKLIDRHTWEQRWNKYLNDLYNFIMEYMVGEDAHQATKITMEKIEKSAWRTMPAEFQKRLEVPRPIRK